MKLVEKCGKLALLDQRRSSIAEQEKDHPAVAALVVIAAVLLLVWRAVTPKGEAGEKTITVQVLHKGGEERVFTLETGEAYLARS